jgi:hypothetical protein
MADLTLAQMLALLPDNTTGLISAEDVRDVITAVFERTNGTNAIDGLLFDTTPVVPAHTPGHVHWNATEGTLDVMGVTPDQILQVGHETYITARNTTGSTILNGSPVRITGASGQQPLVALDNGMGTIVGIATHDIPNNSNGKITTFGLVHDLNTSAFSDGAAVYSTATGTLTTAFTGSFVGLVLLAHPNTGVVLVTRNRQTPPTGTTAQRPTVRPTGYAYFDTTLGQPVWWDGATWVDATGTPA